MRWRVRWPFLVVLFAAVVYGTVGYRDHARRQTEILASTTCPWGGPPVMVISPALTGAELSHVTAHESIHAEQCRTLGPLKYRLRNLTSKLELEAPAYCAGARVHIAHGTDTVSARSRLVDDAVEALRGTADSAEVLVALREACPALFRIKPPDPRPIRV